MNVEEPPAAARMDEREKRIGLNEAVFRELNDRLQSVNETFATFTEKFEIVCECGDSGCIERITLAATEYEAVRADAALFVVVPGHDATDVEEVVRSGEGYDVIRKHEGRPRELAAQTDPREKT